MYKCPKPSAKDETVCLTQLNAVDISGCSEPVRRAIFTSGAECDIPGSSPEMTSTSVVINNVEQRALTSVVSVNTMYSVIASLLLMSAYQASGHSYHLGDCPTVEPAKDFDMNKFLGKWYVIQKTNTGSGCLINNYTKDEEHPGKFKIEQISEHFLLGLTSVDHKYHYTGDLSIPDSGTPASMRVRFPLNVAGGASYTVFMTDYDTYAGIFTCQQLTFAHRRSVSILSRTNTLDKPYLDKIRNRLSSFGIDPYNLSIIKQGNCTEVTTEHTTNININDETFTASSVANVFRKAGEKIGDGFESVADSAKKVYNRVRGDHENSNEELNQRSNPKDDVEWLP